MSSLIVFLSILWKLQLTDRRLDHEREWQGFCIFYREEKNCSHQVVIVVDDDVVVVVVVLNDVVNRDIALRNINSVFGVFLFNTMKGW